MFFMYKVNRSSLPHKPYSKLYFSVLSWGTIRYRSVRERKVCMPPFCQQLLYHRKPDKRLCCTRRTGTKRGAEPFVDQGVHGKKCGSVTSKMDFDWLEEIFDDQAGACDSGHYEVEKSAAEDSESDVEITQVIRRSPRSDEDIDEVFDEDIDEIIDVKESPIKKKSDTNVDFYLGNKECKLIRSMESTENPFLVPLLMNCTKENPELISGEVPCRIQQNGSFILDLEQLESKEDIVCDDNGVWIQNSCKTKLFSIKKDQKNKVTEISRVPKEENSDVAVRRRQYYNKSCPTFHRMIVSIEYGRSMDMWHKLVFLQYRYDGEEVKFEIPPHQNSKKNKIPHVRTKHSTKRASEENLKDHGPKRALFKTTKDVGGITANNQGTLPKNTRQLKHLKAVKKKESQPATKDPLASVIELQKSYLSGFVREITCNDLPTIMLFTDQQIDNIIKFCCTSKRGQISELGVDLTFQLGPFYLLVTTYKNTVLQVKGSLHSPVYLGPTMICLAKDQSTYLSFIHRLIREVPGLSQCLHVYGSDSEDALINAMSAGFPNASHLLCYIHCKKNVQHKLKQIGISQPLTNRICADLFGRNGLVWSNSSAEFEERANKLLQEWDELESKERNGEPQFSKYFIKFKKQEMKDKMCKFVVSSLGVGDSPYTQNVVESVNDLIKDWMNFTPQDMDSLVLALYELVDSYNQEEELCWFGLSEKWEVRQEFQKYCPPSFNILTPEERSAEIDKVRKVKPDPQAYKQCKEFKFRTNSTKIQGKQSTDEGTINLHSLKDHFSMPEINGLTAKAQGLLHSQKFRLGFKERTYLLDSGGNTPYIVTSLQSGKTTCTCPYYMRNNICYHCIGIAKHKNTLDGLLKSYQGRNLSTMTTCTASSNVGSKNPQHSRPKKRQHEASESSATMTLSTGCDETLTSTQIDATTIVIKRNQKPEDPPASAPLVIKRISGGIRKCAGCGKPILHSIDGYAATEDSKFCLSRYEAYNYWNKNAQSYQMTSGARHYHMNPVCTKLYRNRSTCISKGGLEISNSLNKLLVDRFGLTLAM